MSIEKALEDLKAAIDANTAALLKVTGETISSPPETAEKPAAEGKRGPGRPPKADKEETKKPSGVDRSAMQAALNEVKEAKGVAEAKRLIKEEGGVDKMADIPDGKVQAVYDAAKAIMEGGDEDM